VADPPSARAWHSLRRHIRTRQRLLVSAAVGVALALAIPDQTPTHRVVVGWDCAIGVFLGLIVVMAARADPASMRRRAALEDEGGWAFLALMAGAAFFSMFAILDLMREAKAIGGSAMVRQAILGGVTILLSWLFAHTVFAVHYAHDYFKDLTANRTPGLAFPGQSGDDLDYGDFFYFSFVIGMTAQVSDVQVLTQRWRRLVLAHSILSFLFNTAVLALSINLLAGFF
jgi:uncharacterized membrane protein